MNSVCDTTFDVTLINKFGVALDLWTAQIVSKKNVHVLTIFIILLFWLGLQTSCVEYIIKIILRKNTLYEIYWPFVM